MSHHVSLSAQILMIRAHCLAENVTFVRLKDFLVPQGQELTVGLGHLLVRMRRGDVLLRVDPVMGWPLLGNVCNRFMVFLLLRNRLERLDLVVCAVGNSNQFHRVQRDWLLFLVVDDALLLIMNLLVREAIDWVELLSVLLVATIRHLLVNVLDV